MSAVLVRLAFAGLRSRLLASALTVVIGAAAVATIVIALEVRSAGVDPWQRTFAEANGAHVLAFARSRSDAAAVAGLPGVTEHDAPAPQVLADLRSHGSTHRVQLTGSSRRPEVNRPVSTAGSGLGEAGIVLERSFARALGIQVGARIAVAGSSGSVGLPVLGTAIVPSQARYPRSNPGVAWVSPSTFARVEPDRARWRWSEAVRLEDPSAASALAARAAATIPAEPGELSFETWQAQRDNALGDAQGTQVIVTMFTILLLVVAFVVVGILAGARAGEESRQIGLLKAVGFTPRQVGIVFALESAALGLVAAGLGFALGAVLAPRLAEPSAETLLGSPTIAASPWHLVVAGCVLIPVLVAGALTSTRRSTRFTVLEAIHAGVPSPPRARLARAARRLTGPVTVELGVTDFLARGRRAFLLVAAIVITGVVVVSALSLNATLDAQPASKPSDFPDELRVLIYALDTILLVITATTLVAVALLAVRERYRELGVLKAVGFTPGQIVSSIVGANAAVAVLASFVAIPIGIAVYFALVAIASGTTDEAVIAAWWSLALIPVGALLVVVAATSVPAWLATRIHAADALRYE